MQNPRKATPCGGSRVDSKKNGRGKMFPMKEEKKSGEDEPTISDVLEAVQTGFAKVEERLGRIEGIADQHEGTLTRHDKLLTTLVAGQENLTERVNGIDQRLTATQNRVEDVAEMLENMTEVVDENRDMLFKHGERIAVLEKATA